jgi:DNA-binding response OmpR family regulator
LAIAGQRNASLYSRIATTFGAAAALRKPFNADELLRAVATLLDGGANRKGKDPRRSHLKRSGHRMAG